MLLRSALHRRTLSDDAAAFVAPQFWKHANSLIFWDLNYFFNTLRQRGLLKQKRKHWLKWFSDKVAAAFPGEQQQTHITADAAALSSDVLRANTCTTLGVYTYIWIALDICDARKEAVLWPTLKSAADRACSTISTGHRSDFSVDGNTIGVRSDGHVLGFCEFLARSPMKVYTMFRACWARMRQLNMVCCDLDADTLSLADVMQFASKFARCRRAEGRKPSESATHTLAQFANAFLKWLAARIDEYVDRAYGADNQNVHKAPPALHSAVQRRYVTVAPEAAWDLMGKARASRCNTKQALALKKDEADLGCHGTRADLWQNRFLQMYYKRCRMLFGSSPQGINHWCFVADPGHHSYKESLVSLVFSWELNAGCYAPWMHLVPGKAIAPGEVDMLDAVERAREANKLERVASFRQLQGISKQLSYITNGVLSADSFSLPSSCNVRPVGANERRVVVNVGDRCLHKIINDDTGSQVEVVPLDVDDIKLLLLMLDQGSIGTSGVAFFSVLPQEADICKVR